MQRNIAETIMGAGVLAVAAGFLFFFYTAAELKTAEGYPLTAEFSKADGLAAGSPVRISGIKVGQIIDFTLNPETFAAVVTMHIDDNIKLPADTAAVITSAGLLDGKFMTLEPGGDEEILKPGAKIAYTQSTPSLEQLLGQVIFSLTDKSDKKEDGDDAASSAPVPMDDVPVSTPAEVKAVPPVTDSP